MRDEVYECNVASSGTTSGTFLVPEWGVFVGVEIPNIDAGDVGMEMSLDGGSTFSPILDPTDGDDLLVLKSGSDPGIVDISDFLRFAPHDAPIRFTCVAQNSGAVTLKVMVRG